jgi:hypothetical protein
MSDEALYEPVDPGRRMHALGERMNPQVRQLSAGSLFE